MPLLNVTAGSGTNTQVSTQAVYCKQILMQNNAAHSIWIADDPTVTDSGGANPGLLLVAGAALNIGSVIVNGSILSSWYFAGTAGDKLTVDYIPQ